MTQAFRRTVIAAAAASVLAIAGTWIVAAITAPSAHAAAARRLSITILGRADDARIRAVHEAIAHWNAELARLGLYTRLDSARVVDAPIPEAQLRAASEAQASPSSWFADRRLRGAMADVPGDIVIALSNTDMISFGVPLDERAKGLIGIRRGDVPPLSLPNTVRNVAAHEVGHVLGLAHNADSTTLMCGRPASCRPAAFASDSARFFPLTEADERRLRAHWP